MFLAHAAYMHTMEYLFMAMPFLVILLVGLVGYLIVLVRKGFKTDDLSIPPFVKGEDK